MKLRVLLLILTIPFEIRAATGGAPLNQSDAISNSLVNIKMQNGMCSGTLISETTVITAAHCRDRLGKVEFVAKIGEGTTDACDISEVVETAYIPKARTNLPFHVHNPDILLIRLKSRLCHAVPVTLATTPIMIGERAFATGLGQGSPGFGLANKIEIQLIPFETALKTVSPLIPLHRDLMFAGQNSFRFAIPTTIGNSLCEGDSGGPIYREVAGTAYLMGVTSAVLPNVDLGAPGCDQSYLQVFTPIAPYISAIRKFIAEARPTGGQ